MPVPPAPEPPLPARAPRHPPDPPRRALLVHFVRPVSASPLLFAVSSSWRPLCSVRLSCKYDYHIVLGRPLYSVCGGKEAVIARYGSGFEVASCVITIRLRIDRLMRLSSWFNAWLSSVAFFIVHLTHMCLYEASIDAAWIVRSILSETLVQFEL